MLFLYASIFETVKCDRPTGHVIGLRQHKVSRIRYLEMSRQPGDHSSIFDMDKGQCSSCGPIKPLLIG
jgi:hypothetical protein